MRIHVGGVGQAVHETKLALRFAGFIVDDHRGDFRIIVSEDELIACPTVDGVDCPLERIAVARLAEHFGGSVVSRRGTSVRSDQALAVTVPATDEARRGVSQAIVETFLVLIEDRIQPRRASVLAPEHPSVQSPSVTVPSYKSTPIDRDHTVERALTVTEHVVRQLVTLSGDFGRIAQSAVEPVSVLTSLVNLRARVDECAVATDARIAEVARLLNAIKDDVAVAKTELEATRVELEHERRRPKPRWWHRFVSLALVAVMGAALAAATDDTLEPLPSRPSIPLFVLLQISGQGFDPSTNTLRITCVAGCSGSAGATFGSAFPSTGTAIGAKDSTGTNMVPLNLDASGNLLVAVTGAGSGGTSSADGAAWSAGTTAGTPAMGARDDAASGTVAEDKLGVVRITTNRAQHANLRDASGNELGIAAAPVQVSLANTGANATAVKVDGSAVTQPISQSALTTFGTTQRPWDSTAASPDRGISALAVRKDSPTVLAVTTDVYAPMETDASGRLYVNGSSVTQPVSGTVTTTPPSNASTNVAQFGGSNVVTGTGVGGAGIPRVTVSSDSTVTANAGTNLNTSLLALESGGNLATLAGTVTAARAAVNPISGQAGVAGNTGLVGATTQRVTLATDVALPTGANTIGAVTQASGPWTSNVTQFGSTNVSTGTGTGGAGIPRVTVSSDSTLTSVGSITNTVTAQGTLTNNNASPSTNNVGALVARATASAPSYTEGNMVTLSTDNAGALRVSGSSGGGVAQTQVRSSTNTWTDVGYSAGNLSMPVTESTLQQLLAALLVNAQQSGYVKGTFGNRVASTGDALNVALRYPAPVWDPCLGPTKNSVNISQTSSTRLLLGGSGRYVVCHMKVVGADAENVSLVEGLGTTCGTGTLALDGGTTAAAGPNYLAGGGAEDGTGGAAILFQAIKGNDICLLQSGAGRVAGHLTYALILP